MIGQARTGHNMALASQPAPARPRPGPAGDPIVDKAVMALTGAFLGLYVLIHLVGNLKIFLGPGQLDHYGEWLRDLGQPLLPRTLFLWAFRVVLTAAFVAHMVAAGRIVRRNRWAAGDDRRPRGGIGSGGRHRLRPLGSRGHLDRYAAATMPLSGIVVAAFVLFHLFDLTWGPANPDFVRGQVEHNVVVSLQRWPVAAFYTLAMLALGLHLVHGTWSLFSSLGFSGRRVDHIRRVLATAVPTVVVLGNLAIPVAVLAGWVS